MEERYSINFSRDEVRSRVLPAYMGLIKQIDDQSVRVPLIVVDPDKRADATRGSTSQALVDMIDLAPTFLESFGGTAKPHILEGRALQPLLHANASAFSRKAVISEYDYSGDLARIKLSSKVSDSRMTMVFDGRWKYIHIPEQRPMLFDLNNDPNEFDDLGESRNHQDEIERLQALMFEWARRPATRTTVSDNEIAAYDHVSTEFDLAAAAGIIIGYWDEAELEADAGNRKRVISALRAKLVENHSNILRNASSYRRS